MISQNSKSTMQNRIKSTWSDLVFCEINLRLQEIPNLLMISQNSATEPERKDECKFTQPFQLRIDFQKQLTVH